MCENKIRLSLVSSPRSGNTWLRFLLRELYQLEQYGVHKPDELSWERLPDRCIVQLHWPRTESYVTLLQKHSFRTVTIARHPLDVLLSILSFSITEPRTAFWLAGAGGDEKNIIGKEPTSKEFLEYALSDRFGYLLSVTRDWWKKADASLKYEDLVLSSVGELGKLSEVIGETSSSIDDVVEKCSFGNLKHRATNNHFWKGRPGHWRQYIPRKFAFEIYQKHKSIFDHLGYDIEVVFLDEDECKKNWENIDKN